MPKVLQDFLGYAIYFWANENNAPPHVHVSKGRQTANATKFWIKRDGVELAHNDSQIPANELRKIETYLLANQDTILAAWFRFFNM